jgi:hypothetical protein
VIGNRKERIKFFRAGVTTGTGAPGRFLAEEMIIACGSGAIRILAGQRPGKTVMNGSELIRGAQLAPGTVSRGLPLPKHKFENPATVDRRTHRTKCDPQRWLVGIGSGLSSGCGRPPRNLSAFIDDPNAVPTQSDIQSGTILTSNTVTPRIHSDRRCCATSTCSCAGP